MFDEALAQLIARLEKQPQSVIVSSSELISFVFALSNRWRGDIVYEDHHGGLATGQLTETAFTIMLNQQLFNGDFKAGPLRLEPNQVTNGQYFTASAPLVHSFLRAARSYRLAMADPTRLVFRRAVRRVG
ncbi:hypothetical protein [Lacticaseibacillus daqingensis]|uniref:hypothetical protein n=1 Tax=Lacticaseibacillus daqingensis TaxID=2486014 RepID=UPI000F77709F|nr:hypothetical protein [Lacticaseibacillus daqingensis]